MALAILLTFYETLLGNTFPSRRVLYFPISPQLEIKMENTLTPRIYVVCLATFNAGYSHGDWIEVTQDEENIYKEIRQILADSPIETSKEWAIHDYEDFGSIKLKEHESVASICEKAQFVLDYGEVGLVLFEYYNDLEEIKEIATNRYHGEWDSELEFATELFDDCYLHEIPEHLNGYIDYEQFTYEIFINDYFSLDSQNNKKHIFSNY